MITLRPSTVRPAQALALISVLGACTGPSPSRNPDAGAARRCQFQSQCEAPQICVGESCVTPPTCITPDDWVFCLDALDAQQPGLGVHAYCNDAQGICAVACWEDSECADGDICTDFGHCVTAPPVTQPPPGGGTRAPLRAGYGAALLDIPVLSPLGGYGGRFDPSPSRYGGGLAASRGTFDGLEARALYLDNGEHPLMLIRLPLIFVDMSLHEEVARVLAEQTGKDWRNHLVISASHTHSGPARLWPLPAATVLPLGLLGAGDHSRWFFDHAVRSTADAALAALADARSAQLGWTVVESFDTDDQVGRDRRGETPPFDDNRTLLIRVDDSQSSVPMAVLFSFGAHGTANEMDYLTQDVLGGAERALEDQLGRTFNTYVPAMFFNQNSGSMSPADHGGHEVPAWFEALGRIYVSKVWTALAGIQTHADVELGSRTVRFPYTHRAVGFEPGEWTNTGDLPFAGDLRFGGIQCFGSFDPGSDLSAFMAPEALRCFGLHTFGYNRPPTPLTKSQVTALNIDGLAAVTMPGELTMELSWLILRTLQDQLAINPLQAWTFGYAQDHQLYLMPDMLTGPHPPFPGLSTPMDLGSYPPRAFSFLRGGYEASLSQLGWKSGDFLVARAVEAMTALQNQDPQPQLTPHFFTPPVEAAFAVDDTAIAALGTVLTDMPAQVTRLTPVEFAWVGGDPGAEMPQAPLVTLEQQTGPGMFQTVLMPSRRVYSDRDGRFVVRVRKPDMEWEWVARWEEVQAFPTGTYRIHVQGHAQVGGVRQDYQVASSPFSLVATAELQVSATANGRDLMGTVAYPPGARLTASPTLADPGRVQGSFRMRHVDVPESAPSPLIPDQDVTDAGITVEFRQGGNLVSTQTVDQVALVTGSDNRPQTQWQLTAPALLTTGTYDVTVLLVDTHGNQGTTTLSWDVP